MQAAFIQHRMVRKANLHALAVLRAYMRMIPRMSTEGAAAAAARRILRILRAPDMGRALITRAHQGPSGPQVAQGR